MKIGTRKDLEDSTFVNIAGLFITLGISLAFTVFIVYEIALGNFFYLPLPLTILQAQILITLKAFKDKIPFKLEYTLIVTATILGTVSLILLGTMIFLQELNIHSQYTSFLLLLNSIFFIGFVLMLIFTRIRHKQDKYAILIKSLGFNLAETYYLADKNVNKVINWLNEYHPGEDIIKTDILSSARTAYIILTNKKPEQFTAYQNIPDIEEGKYFGLSLNFKTSDKIYFTQKQLEKLYTLFNSNGINLKLTGKPSDKGLILNNK